MTSDRDRPIPVHSDMSKNDYIPEPDGYTPPEYREPEKKERLYMNDRPPDGKREKGDNRYYAIGLMKLKPRADGLPRQDKRVIPPAPPVVEPRVYAPGEIPESKKKPADPRKVLPWRMDAASAEAIDRAFGVAQWWENLSATSNEAFLPLYFCDARYLVLMGGAGSGKSIFAGRKLLERVTTEQGHRFLVCRKVQKTLRESCFAQLVGQLSDHYPDVKWSANKTDMVITIEDTDSRIIFAGLDDVEKLKSIYNITSVWVEEASEVEEDDFLELDRRLRGDTAYYQQIMVSFNPISVMHWLKRRFFDRASPDVVAHRSNYLDNRFMPEENRRTLEAYRETDPYHYSVYCLGEWGITGTPVFDVAAINRQLARRIAPVKTGEFRYDYNGTAIYNIRFESGYGDVPLLIYREPEPGAPYVIGGDTAGDGSDSFVAQVIDNRTGEQVAILRHQFDEDVYARQVFCLGLYYNTALVGIEANYSTYPIRELQRLGYPKQYVRETVDTFKGAYRHSYGFMTTSNTRPLIIAGLVEATRGDMSMIVDKTTLLEMSTFIRNEKMRPEAERGAHDDCVMALAIAHYIRPQQSRTATGAFDERVTRWTRDMFEDYQQASVPARQYLLEKWGKPSNYSIRT